jgi:hypothetical protein
MRTSQQELPLLPVTKVANIAPIWLCMVMVFLGLVIDRDPSPSIMARPNGFAILADAGS